LARGRISMASSTSVNGTPACWLTMATSAVELASKIQMARPASGKKNPPKYRTTWPWALDWLAESMAACWAAAY